MPLSLLALELPRRPPFFLIISDGRFPIPSLPGPIYVPPDEGFRASHPPPHGNPFCLTVCFPQGPHSSLRFCFGLFPVFLTALEIPGSCCLEQLPVYISGPVFSSYWETDENLVFHAPGPSPLWPDRNSRTSFLEAGFI